MRYQDSEQARDMSARSVPANDGREATDADRRGQGGEIPWRIEPLHAGAGDETHGLARLSVLLERLVAAQREQTISCVCISAHTAHQIRSVDITQSQFGIVMRGSKQLRAKDTQLDFCPGDILVACAGVSPDFRHFPDPVSGQYLTLVVPICDQVLEAARLVWNAPVVAHHARRIARFCSADHVPLLTGWAEAILANDYPAARAALVSLVIDWCRQGMTTLLVPPPPTLASRVRETVMAQPERPWQSRDFEALLGMSGATLRRRLAAEGTSLRAVMTDARLACGMIMLYTTNLPIKTVAARVGYQSSDGFARAFRNRYGLDPSEISGDHHSR